MKKKLTKGIFLAILCWLMLGTLPGLALEEEVKQEVATEIDQGTGRVKNRVKDRIVNKAESGTRKGLKFLPFGEAVGDLLFGSEAEKSLEVQKEILETNQNTLTQIKVLAKDALSLKRKIEEMDRLRRSTIRLGQSFRKTSYSRMALALGDRVLGISLNPSDYIPNTSYTKKLKRNLDYRYNLENQFFSGTKRFLKSTRKAVSFKERGYKNTSRFQKRLVEASAYDRHVEEYVAARNHLLAQEHEQLADSLLAANRELQAVIDDEAAHMSAAKIIQTKHIMDKNVSKALFHKAKANTLLKENSQVSKSDQEKLASEEEYALCQELIAQELKALQNRNRSASSWMISKQKGGGKAKKRNYSRSFTNKRVQKSLK
jgi:hypothetical protein